MVDGVLGSILTILLNDFFWLLTWSFSSWTLGFRFSLFKTFGKRDGLEFFQLPQLYMIVIQGHWHIFPCRFHVVLYKELVFHFGIVQMLLNVVFCYCYCFFSISDNSGLIFISPPASELK